MAIYYSILSFLPYLHNQHVLIHSGNTTAVSYISKMGGMMDFLKDKIARLVWQTAYDNNFWITISYIPGIQNLADFPSHALNPHLEWTLPKDCSVANTKCFGFPTVNLFASKLNAQLPNYVSGSPDLMHNKLMHSLSPGINFMLMRSHLLFYCLGF